MAEARATLTSGQIGIRIIYDVEGLVISSSNGVVTSTTAKKVPREVLPSSYPWTTYILSTGQFQLDSNKAVDINQSEFWTKFLNSFPQPSGGDLGSQALPWMCEWGNSTATFYQTDTTNVLTKLPDAQFVDVYVTQFKSNIPLQVEYYDAISKTPISTTPATETFNCNMPSSTHQWNCYHIPSGYYAASAAWKDKDFIPTGFNSFTLADLPVLYDVRGAFTTNNHICRTLRSNQGYEWKEGNISHSVSTCYRNASTMQTMSVLYYTYVQNPTLNKPTMIIYCHPNGMAPTKYSITYKHDSNEQEILATETKTAVYVTKDFKTTSGKTLYEEHLGGAKIALEAYDTVPTRDDSIIEVETRYTENFPNENREIIANSLVRAKYLILSAQGTMKDNTTKIIDISNQQYEISSLTISTLFPTPKKSTITNAEGVQTEALLTRGDVQVNGATLEANAESVNYKTVFNANVINFTTIYSFGTHSIRLKYMLKDATTDSTGKHYYQEYLNTELEVDSATKTWDMYTDNLQQTIFNLVGQSVGEKFMGSKFVYYPQVDADIINSKIQPNKWIVAEYKPQYSSFTISNLDALKVTLQHCVDNNITELSIPVNILRPYRYGFQYVSWTLHYQNNAVAENSSTSFEWIYYPELPSYNFRTLFTARKQDVPFTKVSKIGDWNIDTVTAQYVGDITNKTVTTSLLSDYRGGNIYIKCIKKYETVTLNINASDDAPTIYRNNGKIYTNYTYTGKESSLTISKDLSQCTLYPLFSGGKLIFVSDGTAEFESKYDDFPENNGLIPFITLEDDKFKYIYKVNGNQEVCCNKAVNVDTGMSLRCRHIEITKYDTSFDLDLKLRSATPFLNNNTPKRNFIIGFVGAGGGGGGGSTWFWGNRGGSGGGSGGSGAWQVYLKSSIEESDIKKLRIKYTGGKGGSRGGESEDGQNGAEMLVELQVYRNGSYATLATWKVPGGGKGHTDRGAGGLAGGQPILVSSTTDVIINEIYSETGAAGLNSKDKAQRDKTDHTSIFTDFAYTKHAWMGVQMDPISDFTSHNVSSSSNLYMAYTNGIYDSEDYEAHINTLLNSSSNYQQQHLFSLMRGRLLTRNNDTNGKNSDDNRGGAGGASVLGVCTQFVGGHSAQYEERPNPGCGGCGGGRWSGTHYIGRDGGHGAILIFC